VYNKLTIPTQTVSVVCVGWSAIFIGTWKAGDVVSESSVQQKLKTTHHVPSSLRELIRTKRVGIHPRTTPHLPAMSGVVCCSLAENDIVGIIMGY